MALSKEKPDAFMNADLSRVDLPVVQIDGLHASDDLVLVAAIGIDTEGGKHPPLLCTREHQPQAASAPHRAPP